MIRRDRSKQTSNIPCQVQSLDGSWGSENEDGSWNGVVIKWRVVTLLITLYLQIGMIERQEVDIGVTSFFATIKRQEVVDFSPIIDYAE